MEPLETELTESDGTTHLVRTEPNVGETQQSLEARHAEDVDALATEFGL